VPVEHHTLCRAELETVLDLLLTKTYLPHAIYFPSMTQTLDKACMEQYLKIKYNIDFDIFLCYDVSLQNISMII
jgi:hypothetical protein